MTNVVTKEEWLALSWEKRLQHVSVMKLKQVRDSYIQQFEAGGSLNDDALDAYLTVKQEIEYRSASIPDGAFVNPDTNKKL